MTTTSKNDASELRRLPTGTTILVVDDVTDIQAVLRLFLEHRGAKVLTSTGGAEAIEIALTARPDLILMDMLLPDLNGYIATRRLRSAGFDKPIIAMTATAAQGGRELCLRSGCTDYLAKPVDLGQLSRTLDRHLLDKS
jgi:CheY-like chemotaxis protein